MPKGKIRASGGAGKGRLNHCASLSRMRRHGQSAQQPSTIEEVRRLRSEVRDAFKFYLAQNAESVTGPELRQRMQVIGTAARRLAAAPDNRKWAARLDQHLFESRTKPKSRVLRKAVYDVASSTSVQALERTLHDDQPAHEHVETLLNLAKLENQSIAVTRYRDPALPGLLAVIIPIWERITGRRVWARHQTNGPHDDWVSPLHPWLVEVLGEEAPTIDILNRAIILQKRSK